MAQTSVRCGLLPFIAEIRNKIYHHVFNSKKYLILWPVASPSDSTPPGTAADLALLRVSKITREEAMRVMYAKCEFRYLMDFAVEVHSPLPPLQALKLINDITLEFRSGPGDESAQTSVAVLKLLAGTNIPCEKLRIVLNVQKLKPWTRSRRQTRVFFDALKGLKDFRTVIIEIKDVGAPIEGEVKGDRHIGYTCHLQFYPREHVLATMEQKAANLEAKVADLKAQADVTKDKKVFWLEVQVANLRTLADWKQEEQRGRLERSYWESVSIS